MMQGPPGAPQGPPPDDIMPDPLYGYVGDSSPRDHPGAPPQSMAMVVPRGPRRAPSHIPLAKLRVLYLGSAVPLQTREGLEAVQGPLRERYPYMSDGDVSGIDAWLTVFSSGVLMKYLDERNTVAWFPIQTLHVCAAVKCVVDINGVTGERCARFVALDSPAGKASRHPPMFACIMRRTKGVKVLECHAFLTKSNQAALASVQACTHAYEHKEGWTDEMPPGEVKQNGESRLVAADSTAVNKAPPEFFEKPPQHGYFYTSRKDLIKSYNVFGDRRGGDAHSEPPGPRLPRSNPRAVRPTNPAHAMSAMPAMVPPGALPMVPPPIFMPTVGPGLLPPGMPILAPPPPPASVMAVPHPYMLPPPPAGYFADWERYGGRPVNVFPLDPAEAHRSRQRHRKSPPRTKKSFPSPPKVKPRRPRSASPTYTEYSYSEYDGDYYDDDQYSYDDRPQRHGHREEYNDGGRVERRTADKGDYGYHRNYSHVDKHGDYGDNRTYGRHDEYGDHREHKRGDHREHSDRRDVYGDHRDYGEHRDYGRGERVYGDYGELPQAYDRRGEPSDLELYAPRYQRRLPGNQRSKSHEGPRRRQGDDYVEYNSHFSPEIYMRDNRDPRERDRERADYHDQDYDDVYNRGYDREIEQYSRYPRQDREFGNSIREERRALGDYDYDPYYRGDRDYYRDDNSQVDYDMFQGRDRKPYNGLEQSLGYYP